MSGLAGKVIAEKPGYLQPCRTPSALAINGVLDVYLVSEDVLSTTGVPSSMPILQPTLSGLVFEQTSQGARPIPGAVLALDFTGGLGYAISAATRSDATGRSLLCGVDDVGFGLLLYASAEGYLPVAVPIDVRATRSVDIELTPDPAALAQTPPNGQCVTPDPFVAFGGGICVNGGWMMMTSVSPPPPPPPPPGCVTPDPFVAFGGGICLNGGWMMRTSVSPPPPPPPPPPPLSPPGCVTPDPFVAFGGGICVNGGWMMRTSASPPPPPPPPPPPSPPGCVTPDPFVAFGGGICVNGGWMMVTSVPSTAPAAAPADTSGLCDARPVCRLRRRDLPERRVDDDDVRSFAAPAASAAATTTGLCDARPACCPRRRDVGERRVVTYSGWADVRYSGPAGSRTRRDRSVAGFWTKMPGLSKAPVCWSGMALQGFYSVACLYRRKWRLSGIRHGVPPAVQRLWRRGADYEGRL